MYWAAFVRHDMNEAETKCSASEQSPCSSFTSSFETGLEAPQTKPSLPIAGDHRRRELFIAFVAAALAPAACSAGVVRVTRYESGSASGMTPLREWLSILASPSPLHRHQSVAALSNACVCIRGGLEHSRRVSVRCATKQAHHSQSMVLIAAASPLRSRRPRRRASLDLSTARWITVRL